MKDLLWNLFKKTGDVKYFLLKQELEKRSDDREDIECERNLSQRDELQ